jgi:hypothetical protein
MMLGSNTTPFSKLLSAYCLPYSKLLAKRVFTPLLSQTNPNISCEVDPAVCIDPEERKGNMANLLNLCRSVLQLIFKATSSLPRELIELASVIFTSVRTKYREFGTPQGLPTGRNDSVHFAPSGDRTVVAAFALGKIFAPPLLTPVAFELAPDLSLLGGPLRKSLQLVAKVLLKLAVQVQFEEEYLLPINSWMNAQASTLEEIVDCFLHKNSSTSSANVAKPGKEQLRDTLGAIQAQLSNSRAALVSAMPHRSTELEQLFSCPVDPHVAYYLRLPGTEHHLNWRDSRKLWELPAFQMYLNAQETPTFELVDEVAESEDRSNFAEMEKLAGSSLAYILEDEESMHFRSLANSKAIDVGSPLPIVEAEVCSSEWVRALAMSFIVTVNFPPQTGFMTKSFTTDITKTTSDIIDEAIRRTGSNALRADAFCLKLGGFCAFIIESIPLVKLVYIRDCLKRNRRIQFSLVPRAGLRTAPVQLHAGAKPTLPLGPDPADGSLSPFELDSKWTITIDKIDVPDDCSGTAYVTVELEYG